VYFENRTLGFLEILVELQILLIEYFVLWAGFNFELSGDAKRNANNKAIEWMIIDNN